jgi:hypothetical protein
MGSSGPAHLWRECGDPRGCRRIARAVLEPEVYEHVRGVAQQAARLAAAAALGDERRLLLLRAAWLHDVGLSAPGAFAPLAAARMLRRAGLEQTARIVAHQMGAAYEVILRGLPALTPEFPAPGGEGREAARLLDIAILTTAQDGSPSSPAARIRTLAGHRGVDDPAVRATVWIVDRIGESERSRQLMAKVASTGSRAA